MSTITHIFGYGDSFAAYPSCEAAGKALNSNRRMCPTYDWYEKNYLHKAPNRGWISPIVKDTEYNLRWFGYNAGVGNEVIFSQMMRDITFAISNKTVDPHNILVLLNWTSPDRFMLYTDDVSTAGKLYSYGLNNFSKVGYLNFNSSFIDVDERVKYYYTNFHNTINSIKTWLEQLLLAKLFLEKHSIKFLMTTILDDVDLTYYSHPMLHGLATFSRPQDLLPAMHPWVDKNIEEGKKWIEQDDFHPSDYAYTQYRDAIVFPALKDRYNIVL